MPYEHRAQAFFGEHFDEDGMGNRAVDDEHAFDTGFDGVSTALDFGDHAAGKKHRDNNKFHKKFVAQQVIFGKGIGEHDGHQHGYGCAADRVEECIAVGLEEVRVGEDLLVSIQVKADWPEQDLVVDDGLGTGEGQRCHIHKRQKADKQGKDHDQVDNGVKNDVFFVL